MHHAPYHEQFWVVAGTVASAITIALAVVVTDLFHGWEGLSRVGAIRSNLFIFATCVAITDVGIMCFLLYQAMQALAQRKDPGGGLEVQLWVTVCSLLGVFVIAAVAGYVRATKESEPPGPAKVAGPPNEPPS
jgi:hypothetical protein